MVFIQLNFTIKKVFTTKVIATKFIRQQNLTPVAITKIIDCNCNTTTTELRKPIGIYNN